jgi:hypothetical protein
MLKFQRSRSNFRRLVFMGSVLLISGLTARTAIITAPRADQHASSPPASLISTAASKAARQRHAEEAWPPAGPVRQSRSAAWQQPSCSVWPRGPTWSLPSARLTLPHGDHFPVAPDLIEQVSTSPHWQGKTNFNKNITKNLEPILRADL